MRQLSGFRQCGLIVGCSVLLWLVISFTQAPRLLANVGGRTEEQSFRGAGMGYRTAILGGKEGRFGRLAEGQLEESSSDEDGILLVHTWMDGSLWSGYEMLFAGFLVTQDLTKTKLVHWLSEDWSESDDEAKQRVMEKYSHIPSIEFRMLDVNKLATDTCFENRFEFLERKSVAHFGIRDWANVVRWLLLHRYGGIWIDSDSLPLLDFWGLHRVNRNKLVAGYVDDDLAPPGSTELKERGYFNNNFLHLTDRGMRDKIMEVVCLFRRKPTQQKDDGTWDFENVIPFLEEGTDNRHQMRVLNGWIYNDGVLRLCWIRKDCDIELIGLGETDPTWMRTNDMWPLCEHVSQTLKGYTADIRQLLVTRASSQSSDAYVRMFDWKKHVWVLHHRSSHCRTSNTTPMGALKWMQDLAFRRLGNNLQFAPVQPVDFLAYDPFSIRRANLDVEFTSLLLLVASEHNASAQRQLIRSSVGNPSMWFPKMMDMMDYHFKVLFVVPYPCINENGHDMLLAELYRFDDLLLVDPPVNKCERSSSEGDREDAVIRPMRQGLLKVLNRYESHYVGIFKDDRTFFNVRELFKLLHDGSDGALYDKEIKQIPSLLITHRNFEQLDRELRITQKYGDSHATDFNFESAVSGKGKRYALMTRDVVPAMLGMKSEHAKLGEKELLDAFKDDTEPLLAGNLETHYAALHRHIGRMDFVEKDEFRIHDEGGMAAGLRAVTPEKFGVWSFRYGLERARPLVQSTIIDEQCLNAWNGTEDLQKDGMTQVDDGVWVTMDEERVEEDVGGVAVVWQVSDAQGMWCLASGAATSVANDSEPYVVGRKT